MNVQLSKRMQAVADMAVPGYRVADVGCDHGFVSIYLIQAGVAPAVYAADVRPGPLSRAKEHIAQAGLERYITPVLSDGMQNVPVSALDSCCADMAAGGADMTPAGAQAMVAAGIGGRLTIKILSDWPEKTKNLSWMVLEPQSDIHLVRRWLSENGFHILKENLVYEDGKYYPILFAANRADQRWAEAIAQDEQERKLCAARWDEATACAAGAAEDAACRAGAHDSAVSWQEACDQFGFQTLASGHEVLKEYLLHTIQKDEALLADMKKAGANGAETQGGCKAKAGQPGGRIAQRMAEIAGKIVLGEQALRFTEKLRK